MPKSRLPASQPAPANMPRLGAASAFAEAEQKAREILRERGFPEEAIDAELKRARRREYGQ